MASKRRNMFQKNKTQETTENGRCNLPPFCGGRWSLPSGSNVRANYVKLMTRSNISDWFIPIRQMISVFGSLLERDSMKEMMAEKYKKIPIMLEEEINLEKVIFDEQMKLFEERGTVDIAKHWPPVAGNMLWATAMKRRLLFPLESCKGFVHEVMDTIAVQFSYSKAEEMLELLHEFENRVFSAWAEGIPDQLAESLSKSLVVFNEDSSLSLNYDKEPGHQLVYTLVEYALLHPGKPLLHCLLHLLAVIAALREVRYMKLLEVEGIPDEALELFARDEELHVWTVTLKKTIIWYNKLRSRCRQQEFDIISDEIIAIDDVIMEIIRVLNWNSPSFCGHSVGVKEKVPGFSLLMLEAFSRSSS
ncbi:hypothetical protein AAG570_013759 [Ranatra chinensis]|uniref:Dynein heavy chain tail domain-containing protein n=1 Tax=Ranatra chinensis TaxID=642074 RepID=A0ABD0YD51_9HEMI